MIDAMQCSSLVVLAWAQNYTGSEINFLIQAPTGDQV